MNNRIDTRIAAIAAAIERRRMEQECPEDDLSRSLREFGEELAVLDEQDKAALLEKLNEDGLSLNVDAFERFIADYSEVQGSRPGHRSPASFFFP